MVEGNQIIKKKWPGLLSVISQIIALYKRGERKNISDLVTH